LPLVTNWSRGGIIAPGDERTLERLFTRGIRRGWTFRDRAAIVTPYSEPAPDPDLLHKHLTERVAVAQSRYLVRRLAGFAARPSSYDMAGEVTGGPAGAPESGTPA
jgi:hypothetical protein